MKTLRLPTLLFGIFITPVALGQTDLSGVWEGNLVVAPGQEVEVQFSLERGDDGSYSAVLDAPDQPSITAVPVDSVNIDGSTLTMEVSGVSGLYVGEIGSGTINGTWTQQGTAFDLNLTPYEEPVLSAEDIARIEGSWIGALRPTANAEFELTIVLEFEQNEEGDFVATLSSPDQGGNDIPMDNVALDGNELTWEVNRLRAEFAGELSGEELSGTFTQAGQSFPLAFTRGEYQPAGLAITALDFARLQGPWHGQVSNLNVVLRVEQSGSDYVAFLDSPDQGASDIPVQELSVDGDNLTFAISAINGSFSGTIGAEQLSGEWTQGGQTQALVLEKGLYVPHANLSVQAREQLAGNWQGTVNGTELIFEFGNDSDNFTAVLNIPAMGANGVPVGNIELDGDNLTLTVAAIGASFNGSLAGDQADGEWTRAGSTNPLTLTRQ